MIRVLQFTIAQSKGGRTQYILNNWHYINKTLFRFDFVTFDSRLDFEQDLEAEGCQVFHISCYYKDNPERFIQEFDAVLSNEYDAIHIHTSYWEDAIVEERAKKYRIPKIIIHSHSTGISKALNWNEMNALIIHHYKTRDIIDFSGVTDFCACSEDAAEWLYGDKIPKDEIKILPNAIETARFSFDEQVRNNVRKELQIDDDTMLLGVVGRLVYQKNQEFLINIVAHLKNKCNIKLVVVGSGENERCFKTIARRLGVIDRIIFLGHREDVSELMQGMDVFCMPSRYEAFGMALLEAQCSNLVCIISDKVSKRACIIEKVTALPLEYIEWERKISTIYNNKQYTDRRTRIEVAQAGYDIKMQIKELEKMYAKN